MTGRPVSKGALRMYTKEPSVAGAGTLLVVGRADWIQSWPPMCIPKLTTADMPVLPESVCGAAQKPELTCMLVNRNPGMRRRAYWHRVAVSLGQVLAPSDSVRPRLPLTAPRV